MPDRWRFWQCFLCGAILLSCTLTVRAQGMNVVKGSLPNLGTMAMPNGTLAGVGQPKSQVLDPELKIRESYVGWIDAAAPRSTMGLRFDSKWNNMQPMRAEYYHPQGAPGSTVGFPLPESRVSYQELTTFTEYRMVPWLSVFIEAPYRWMNPEINENRSGSGDMAYGLKIVTWSGDSAIATILLRVYQPSASNAALGTGHWSIEPGLLAAYRFNENLLIEGEARYWVPINGSDFAGDILRYGLGVSWGQRRSSGLWYMPVLEGIGWTVLSGKTMVATSPTTFSIHDAGGQTTVNAYLGLRWGYGANLDFYAGYGHSFTGHFWQRDLFRFEIRYVY